MIKELIFTNTKNFSDKKISIKFDQNVNIIIGPKGGGKSTLFDLIAGLKNNYISKSVKEALNQYNLKFEKAIKFSNEEILAAQLIEKNKKEKENDYRSRTDVIYQDDDVKKNLHTFDDVIKLKENYIKQQILASNSINQMFKSINDLYHSAQKVEDLSKISLDKINWTNTFKMNEKTSNKELLLLSSLTYDPINMINLIKNEIKELEEIEKILDDIRLKFNNHSSFDYQKIIVDNDFENLIKNHFNEIIKKNEKLKNHIHERIKILKKIHSIINIFDKSLQKIINNIKNNDQKSVGLKNYESYALNHFRNVAKVFHDFNKKFEDIISSDIYLDIENNKNQDGIFKFKINEKVLLDETFKDEIFKQFLNAPKGSSREESRVWLKQILEKGLKSELKVDKFNKSLQQKLMDETKIIIDFNGIERDYETLSLGQKSIFGLKYKFQKSINDDLYLDQPEDNLDNNTIATEILPLLNNKKNNQVIIVTHNANIGILSNPKKIIIANLNDEIPYRVAEIMDIIKEQSAYFLEGGKEFLELRYQKIVKEET